MSTRKIAIIDDDPFLVSHLKSALTKRLPGVHVTGVVEPVAPAGFDAYIVDKDFDGHSKGQDVVQRIRLISPGSLVLAYSAQLDREFLRALLREGCEGAFDKGSPRELDGMISVIASHFALGKSGDAEVRGVGNTVRAISGLVHEWNLRLANNGRAHARTLSDA